MSVSISGSDRQSARPWYGLIAQGTVIMLTEQSEGAASVLCLLLFELLSLFSFLGLPRLRLMTGCCSTAEVS